MLHLLHSPHEYRFLLSSILSVINIQQLFYYFPPMQCYKKHLVHFINASFVTFSTSHGNCFVLSSVHFGSQNFQLSYYFCDFSIFLFVTYSPHGNCFVLFPILSVRHVLIFSTNAMSSQTFSPFYALFVYNSFPICLYFCTLLLSTNFHLIISYLF